MDLIYTTLNWLLLFLYLMLTFKIILNIFINRCTISEFISWLSILYIFPFIGIILYILLGKLNIDKKIKNKNKIICSFSKEWIENLKSYKYIFTKKNSNVAYSVFQLCKHSQGIDGLTGNKIKLLVNSFDFIDELIHDIKYAKKNIEIVFYAWKVEGLINKVTNALISASKRGVRCKLILDSIGSMQFFHSIYHNKMRDAGIIIIKALQINILDIFFRRIDLRQHKKMILIDNYISYIGSMNMVDPRFFKKNFGIGRWIDIMLRMEGPVTIFMKISFSCDWAIETGERILFFPIKLNVVSIKKFSKHVIQIVSSGSNYPKEIIQQVLLTSIYSARKILIITTPYLVPSNDLLYAICSAAQRGVKVHIIIPFENDSILVHWASRVFFTELLEAGVLLYQFTGGLLHTKSILIDNQLSFIGTVNLDIRSLLINFEITLIIDSSDFSKDLIRVQKKYIEQSKLLEIISWSRRPYWKKIMEKFFYLFSPLL
ncbi:MAG: cardiolipin synthase A [Candidatus Westeberhardia cardiocondylae]|nr:cardiolipin synthase A [Candidatus Westeberhardia cardiocondylae]